MPDQIFCPIRQNWVAAQPEELVRQHFIQEMTQQKGYPPSSLAIEKNLRQMPHLKDSPLKLPDRRADLVCFAKGIHTQYDIYPLLLLEFKAIKLTPQVIRQVVGYNLYLKAYFFAIANQKEIQLGWYDSRFQNFCFIPQLLSYQDLLAKLK